MKTKTILLLLAVSLLAGIKEKSYAQQWDINGNANATAAGNFLGTQNNYDLAIRTNNTERMRITSGGLIGMGIIPPALPLFPLDVLNTTSLRTFNVTHSITNGSLNAGAFVTASNSGAGATWGMFSYLPSTIQGSGTEGGFFAKVINNSLASLSFGIRDSLAGTGGGDQYGSANFITNSGNGTHYGYYAKLTGSGTGTKYGYYADLTNNGGTRYGFYANAVGNSSWAFYGKGRGYFSDKVGLGITSPVGQLHIKDVEVDLTSGGSLIIGQTTTVNMAFDANEIHARNNNNASTLYLNPLGSPVVINNAGTVDEVTLTTDGALRLGDASSANLAMDDNEIQARYNGDDETLFLNPHGGHVAIGYEYIGGCAGDCPKLSVCGPIRCTEVRIETGWCDYVFDKTYNLKPLQEVSDFIKTNKHLPNIPSAAEVEASGLQLGDISKRMMEKIEELTLYVIDLNDRVKSLENENAELKAGIVNETK